MASEMERNIGTMTEYWNSYVEVMESISVEKGLCYTNLGHL